MTHLIGQKIRMGLAAAVAGVAVLAGVMGPGSGATDAEAAELRGDPPIVDCQVQLFDRLHLTVYKPEMRSQYMDWQWVSWRPILNRWDGSRWVRYLVGGEQMGKAGVYVGPYEFTNAGFTVGNAGYYRVSLEYRWYTNGAVTRYEHLWAGTHYQWGLYHQTAPRTVVVGISGQLQDVTPTGNEISVGTPLPSHIARDWCDFDGY